MTDEFEKALRRALRPHPPGGDFPGRVESRLDRVEVSSEAPRAPVARLDFIRRPSFRSRWLPAALAACIILGIGLFQVRQHALSTARADQARAQLLQALSIASHNINVVRAAVNREENPDS